jgi:lipoyl-dependent peroxiredoxin
MPVRKAEAEWRGDLESGGGTIRFGDGRFEEPYAASSRFGEGTQTNPEELIAAAHAACYAMALSAGLAEGGHPPKRVRTEAEVDLAKTDGGFEIGVITLHVEAEVPGITEDAFRNQAEAARANCPVSKALAGCEIRLDARLR